MRQWLAVLAAALYFAAWNTNVQNKNGDDLFIMIGPFGSLDECAQYVNQLHTPPCWQFQGCAPVG